MAADIYDIAVVGGGHAGLEAAIAAARLGARVALFTMNLDAIGNLPCNPSIGGTAKGHLVREIDALGGQMGLAADATMIQSRMLNRGKGPAVHSLRAQTDRAAYHLYAKKLLENTKNIEIKQAEITDLLTENGKIARVVSHIGEEYIVQAVILATGTYLNGKIHIGETNYTSGPDGTMAAGALSNSLRNLGIFLLRFKTGTPARVHRRSINFSRLQRQLGDEEIVPFSFLTEGRLQNRVECHIAFTNLQTHQVILDNLHRSPLYSGDIEGIGPRYCPSIEDKVVRFADKQRHQIFVEPCGLDTEECYLQGMSSSLPADVQAAMYRTIDGFENLEIMRPAYAIEYDCLDPLQLAPTLECKTVKGLYGAGQVNGTSGYEEAAAQGLLAGINAARKIQGKSPLILPRHQSYIGTLVDDLVTKGVSDPYRMMTSRSEYRLTLRQDNADSRLTPIGREIGLVDAERWEKYKIKEKCIENEWKRLKETRISPAAANPVLRQCGESPIAQTMPAAELLLRPKVGYMQLEEMMGGGETVNPLIAERVSTEIKYAGYIKRQEQQIAAMKKQENKTIPEGFDYTEWQGLRLEAREKLGKIQPLSVGQAARIPGVTPSDIAQLMLALVIYHKKGEKSIQEEREDVEKGKEK